MSKSVTPGQEAEILLAADALRDVRRAAAEALREVEGAVADALLTV